MDTTRTTLLARIKTNADEEAWREFERLYKSLLYRYAKAKGLRHEDAEDVRAECYLDLVRQMADFEYDRQASGFKAWLHTMVNRRVIDRLRKRQEGVADSHLIRELPDCEATPDEVWEQHWRAEHLRHCTDRVLASNPDRDHTAFRMLMLDECSVPEICEQLSMTPNMVYKAKPKVLAEVREKMAELFSDVAA